MGFGLLLCTSVRQTPRHEFGPAVKTIWISGVQELLPVPTRMMLCAAARDEDAFGGRNRDDTGGKCKKGPQATLRLRLRYVFNNS